ncbi:MAG: hypothetical protein GYB31_20690 [Bacteroidetes bacterium]|nr:hypothetical protein [Bacteroidota bacterium]
MSNQLAIIALIIGTSLFMVSCQDITDPNATSETIPELDSLLAPPTTIPCQLDSLAEDGKLYRSPTLDQVAFIRKSTNESGDVVQRMLEIYESEDCQLVNRVPLPPNNSPDFPYFLADINYNQSSHLVGIRGFDQIFCYDLKNEELLPPLSPTFKNERFRVDAQSGMIQHLEIWEHYLIGYAEDQGAFTFDLNNEGQPEAVLPLAEYKKSESDYAQLFLVPAVPAGYYQLLFPILPEGNGLVVNPLLKSPRPLQAKITQSASNNRYIIVREENGNALVVDMQKGELATLPGNLVGGSNEEILDHLRSIN